MRPLPLLVLLLTGGVACRNPSSDEEGATAAPAAHQTGPAPVVTGTVVDARTGKPVAGAVVRGPGGLETKTDKTGRFVLRGLARGASGELVATSAAGASGKNLLRPLEGGTLEVVIHLR
ncbi:MAG TPA: hypothetical protein VF530_04770 [Planctomycetota bacterium]